MLHHLRYKHIGGSNQAKDEVPAAGGVRPEQTTPPPAEGALASSIPFNRKSQRWMEMTYTDAWWESSILSRWLKSSTSQAGNV